jgi:type II secretory pathway pseudopilin PulG
LVMNLNNLNGLTLVELLVSLLLTSIVITIVFFIYLTSSKAYLKWESESSFTDCARLVTISLNNTISDGIKIVNADNSSLTILESNLQNSQYETDDLGRLYKNENAITPDNFKISELEFKYVVKSDSDIIDILNIDRLDNDGDFKISPDELSIIDGVQYSFKLESKKQHGRFDGFVMMRNY